MAKIIERKKTYLSGIDRAGNEWKLLIENGNVTNKYAFSLILNGVEFLINNITGEKSANATKTILKMISRSPLIEEIIPKEDQK